MKLPQSLRGLERAVGLGAEMVATTAVGAGVGWWLDERTGWSPWCLIVFFLLGSVAGFVAVYRSLKSWEDPPR
ncbi:MAG: AtpZ/AtpI family protein [Verrucomicrobiae bacterium]|nr:AtpZ/AtpI family protein [Verrucomicrobiae bacterium]